MLPFLPGVALRPEEVVSGRVEEGCNQAVPYFDRIAAYMIRQRESELKYRLRRAYRLAEHRRLAENFRDMLPRHGTSPAVPDRADRLSFRSSRHLRLVHTADSVDDMAQ